jgi:hypothetical protein
MFVEDFTNLSVGCCLPGEGVIERCPHCGRNGIEEHPNMSEAHFVHVQGSEMLPDGLLTEELDCCPLAPPS